MKIIEWLLSDYQKRCFMVFLAAGILLMHEAFYDFLFGHYLTLCTNTADVLEYVKMDALQNCLFGRAVFSYMRYSGTSNAVMNILVNTVRLENIVAVVLTGCYLSNRNRPEFYRPISRTVIITLAVMILKAAFFGLMVVYAFSSGDTAQGLQRLIIGARVFEIGSIIVMVYLLIALLLYFYRTYIESDALQG